MVSSKNGLVREKHASHSHHQQSLRPPEDCNSPASLSLPTTPPSERKGMCCALAADTNRRVRSSRKKLFCARKTEECGNNTFLLIRQEPL